MILWLVLIGAVIYILLAKPGKRLGDWAKAGETPEDILKKRFISGEISEEEYKKIRKIVND
jgi:uncharacterized membrane protein